MSQPLLGRALAGTAFALILASPSDGRNGAAVQAAASETLAALDLAGGTVQALAVPGAAGQPFSVDLVLGGRHVRVEAAPHSLRSADYRLMVQAADGVLYEEEPGPITTYRGSVAGFPASRAALSLIDGQLHGLIRLSEDEVFAVQPLSESQLGSDPALHVVYDARDALPPQDVFCGSDQGDFGVEQHPGAVPPAKGAGSNLVICEIACDADVQFYNQNGQSVANTEADIELVINNTESAVYETQVEVLYDIVMIVVRTSEPDPYTTNNSGALLDEFSDEWIQNFGAVERDVAHLFTGKNLQGGTIGIANLNGVCSTANGYSLVQSKFSGNLAVRTSLTAHELGHNWGASHCNGSGDCGIMCSFIGGCGPILTFGQGAKNAIKNKKNSSNCLEGIPTGPPSLVAVVPGDVPVTQLEDIELQGDQLFQTQTVTVDGSPLGPFDVDIVNNQTLEVELPLPTSLGSADVIVTTSMGTSNTISFDYVSTDPPIIEAPTNAFTGQLTTWTYAGGDLDPVFFLFGTDPTTVPISGFDILIFATIVPVGNLDALGLGSQSVVWPPAFPFLTSLYSQIVTIDGFEVKASEVDLTITI